MLNDHSSQRLKKRSGIAENQEEFVIRVLTFGTKREDTTGHLRKYLDRQYFMKEPRRKMLVYEGHLFIFSEDDILITTWKLKNVKDLCDLRPPRSGGLIDRRPKKDRRTGPTLRDSYESDDG